MWFMWILAIFISICCVVKVINAFDWDDVSRGRYDRKTVADTFLLYGGIALVALLILPSIYTIQTGEMGVIQTFSESKSTVGPGLNFNFWPIQHVVIYDTKTRELNLQFEAYSKDAQPATGLMTVQYQIRPDEVLEINRVYGSLSGLEQRISPIILERAKSVFADKGAMILVETRAVLSGDIEKRIIPALDQYHIDVTMVALSDIAFSAEFEQKVTEKMNAEQDMLRAQYEKEQAIIKGEQEYEVAMLHANATAAKADGDARALNIMQSAWVGMAQPAKDAMLRQMFYETWDGVLPEVITGDGMDIIISRA